MWQCSYCPFTSSRKWNTQVHEKRKHSTKIENINNELKNNQINNKEIKIEEETICYNKKPAYMATIKDQMKSVLLKNKTD